MLRVARDVWSTWRSLVPVYFFNVRQEDRLGIDEAGVDLPGLEAAHQHATELAREIMCDAVLEGEVALDRSVEVTDEAGGIVLVLPFADVVEVKPPRRPTKAGHRTRSAKRTPPRRTRGRPPTAR